MTNITDVTDGEKYTTAAHTLTAERLRELLDYDPETGIFRWKTARPGQPSPGSEAGHINSHGYRAITVMGKKVLAHRLAWLHVNGRWPGEIDHANGVREDNRLVNLRECTRAENQQNRHRASYGASGLLGAIRAGGGRWRSYIRVGGAYHHLGSFASPEEAHKAYCDAKTRLHTFNPVPRGHREAA